MILSLFLFFYHIHHSYKVRQETYGFTWDKGSEGAVGHVVGGKTSLEGEAVLAPSVILTTVDVLSDLRNVE